MFKRLQKQILEAGQGRAGQGRAGQVKEGLRWAEWGCDGGAEGGGGAAHQHDKVNADSGGSL